MQVNQDANHWLSSYDYVIVGIYLVVTVGIGLYFARRGTKSVDAFFVGGGKIPWWLVSASLIATCSDSGLPMWLGDVIYQVGLEGMWLQWASGIGFFLFVFTIAPLWKRAGIVTDLQLYELRYSGLPAKILRCFKCVYAALFVNMLVMAFSTLAITNIVQQSTGLPKIYCLLILISATLLYCSLSGLWGVAATDFLQFFVAVAGYVVLAILAVKHVGGLSTMTEKLHSMTQWPGHELNILPRINSGGLPIIAVAYLFTIRWIEQASRGGYVAQRIFATPSVRHAMLAALFFTFIYFAILPLPWILTITASKIALPGLESGQQAYPLMALKLLPIGLKGLYVACMLAAFMSTYSTVLNWGSSYVVNDLYRRFLVKQSSPRHYVLVGQLVMIPMALISGIIAYRSASILNLTLYVLLAESGIFTVSLASWFWWRTSAYSEIAAISASGLLMILVFTLFPSWIESDNMITCYGQRLFFIGVGSLVIWFIVTLLTPATDRKVLEDFFRKLRPMGYWRPVSKDLNIKPILSWRKISIGSLTLMMATFGIGFGLLKLMYARYALGLPLIGIGVIGFVVSLQCIFRYKHLD